MVPTPEIWETFSLNARRNEALKNEVRHLAETCQDQCKKTCVGPCEQCFGRVLHALRKRYVTGCDEKDWFFKCGEFRADMDMMLESVASGKTDIRSVMRCIIAGKRIWYHKLATSRIDGASNSDLEAFIESELRSLKCKSDEEILVAARHLSDASDSLQAVNSVFFGSCNPTATVKYVQMLRDGKYMDEVVEQILADAHLQPDGPYKSDEKALHDQLQELLRAKDANDLNSKRRREAADQKAKATGIKVPPCDNCNGEVDPASHIHCSVCFIFFQAGAVPKDVVYCSMDCHDARYPKHRLEHPCSAYAKCDRARDGVVSSSADDEDQKAIEDQKADEDQQAAVVICKECLHEHGIPTQFCNVGCAKNGFQIHRETCHLPNRKPEERSRDEAALDRINFTTYTAKNARDFVIPYEEAHRQACQQSNKRTWESVSLRSG